MGKLDDQLDFLAGHLADADTAWSMGSFGAIAEFMRDADEVVVLDRAGDAVAAVTARGGLRIVAHEKMRPVASESLTTQSWSHRVSLCLPEDNCGMDQRTFLTEIGPDTDALRAEDRAAVLFDLGLGTLQLNACIRSGDADIVTALRKWIGRSLFEPGSGAMAYDSFGRTSSTRELAFGATMQGTLLETAELSRRLCCVRCELAR